MTLDLILGNGTNRKVAGSASNAGVIVIRRTKAKCVDRSIGKMLGSYLGNELGDGEKQTFEEHLRHCRACDSAAFNWRELKRFARRHFHS